MSTLTIPSPQTLPEKIKKPYVLRKVDLYFTIGMIALGFMFCEWISPKAVGIHLTSPGLGVSLFFITAIVMSGIWMYAIGIKQNAKSLMALSVVIIGTLPFTLYDTLNIYILLFGFEAIACLIWVCLSCKNEICNTLSGFVFFDIINQMFVVPFANIAAPAIAIKEIALNRNGSKRLITALIGIIVSLPVIALVIWLLTIADDSFKLTLDKISDAFYMPEMRKYILNIIFGIPVAFYIYCVVFGNTSKRNTAMIHDSHAHNFVDKPHKIASAAIYTPLTILNAIYVIFFAAMTSYLFSGFGNKLPSGLSYAEYARRGFFELCFVATINLFALGFAWWFSKRETCAYPKPLRIIGGIITALTLMLIATAASKMLMYVNTYGLSRLRLYTLWFMLLLACIFIILFIWHIHPFNAGRLIVIAGVVLFLSLFLASTDGIIAKHNVDSYLNKSTKSVDVNMLDNLSDAAVPYIEKLYKNAISEDVRWEARTCMQFHSVNGIDINDYNKLPYASYNLQSAKSYAIIKQYK